jgi:SAM-dependent methyltransferase
MPFQTSHTEVEAELLSSALPAGAVVLEAGCGRRSRLGDYRDRIAELVGVDVDASAGKENSSLDQFVHADLGRRLPFKDGSFDLVYANFVVEHLEDPRATFAEWRRVLRQEGKLMLLTSNVANPYLAVARCSPESLRAFLKRRGPGVAAHDVIPTRYRANKPHVLESLLRVAGFESVSVIYVATLHRYAGERRALTALLRGAERILPPPRRSTIVGLYGRTG